MSIALRSANYWARKAIRNSCGKQVLLHGEKRFAREALRKQESHPKRMAAFAKAKRAASCRTRFQKFGRRGEAVLRKRFVSKKPHPFTSVQVAEVFVNHMLKSSSLRLRTFKFLGWNSTISPKYEIRSTRRRGCDVSLLMNLLYLWMMYSNIYKQRFIVDFKNLFEQPCSHV